jgi:predicted aminopeptidase
MNTRVLVVALLVLVAPLCTFARIGETLAQCKARYGDVVIEGNADMDLPVKLFKKLDLNIAVHFYQERADFIVYLKGDEAFSRTEFDTLIKANGGSKKWEKRGEKDGWENWVTQDESLVAFFNTVPGGSVIIRTKRAVEREAERVKAEEKKRLKDF